MKPASRPEAGIETVRHRTSKPRRRDRLRRLAPSRTWSGDKRNAGRTRSGLPPRANLERFAQAFGGSARSAFWKSMTPTRVSLAHSVPFSAFAASVYWPFTIILQVLGNVAVHLTPS
jgi:hypothetical protein